MNQDQNQNPSLAELRQRVFKHSGGGREGGSWLARRVARPSAIYGTWLAVRLPISAHAVTLGSLVAGLAGSIALGTGSRIGFLLGVAALHLAYWLDHVDGQVARWHETASLEGVYLDYLMHHAQGLALGFAVGFGLASRTGNLGWTLAGFLIASGWTCLNLHNDCRYKAFFQRWKRRGGIRTPAARLNPVEPLAPRGQNPLVWAAQKACEPHVVLMGLSFLAILAAFHPGAWWLAWQAGALAMTILAPLLAVARACKAIFRGTLEAEFAFWFPGDLAEKS